MTFKFFNCKYMLLGIKDFPLNPNDYFNYTEKDNPYIFCSKKEAERVKEILENMAGNHEELTISYIKIVELKVVNQNKIMNTISTILNGRKTYIGLIVAFVGVLGVSQYISETETAILIDNIFQIVGLIIAVYGRIVANKPTE